MKTPAIVTGEKSSGFLENLTSMGRFMSPVEEDLFYVRPYLDLIKVARHRIKLMYFNSHTAFFLPYRVRAKKRDYEKQNNKNWRGCSAKLLICLPKRSQNSRMCFFYKTWIIVDLLSGRKLNAATARYRCPIMASSRI